MRLRQWPPSCMEPRQPNADSIGCHWTRIQKMGGSRFLAYRDLANRSFESNSLPGKLQQKPFRPAIGAKRQQRAVPFQCPALAEGVLLQFP